MARNEALIRGRTLYDERAWRDAYEALSQADEVEPLGWDDLDKLAWAAALSGRDDAFLATLERLCASLCEAGECARAARCAFWISMRLMDLGEVGSASGWLERARRLGEQVDGECAEHGYLLVPTMFQQLGAGDPQAAERSGAEAAAIGERLDEPDLVALARMGQGRARARQGRVADALPLLDEVMVAATTGELSPLVTGVVYCNVIATCQQVYVVDRAREWTHALAEWCDEQPQLVPFTAHCFVHRSEVMQLDGRWPEALDEADRACRRVSNHADRAAHADACYQRGEIHRLRGEWDRAEAAYREASGLGKEPQPGLALLRLAQGQVRAAAGAIRRVLDTATATWQRARFLPAYTEIHLADGDVDAAHEAADELEQIASRYGIATLGAMASNARGAVLLAEGDATGAARRLRDGFRAWQSLGAPYIAARIRVLLARACRELGDAEGAELELAAAREVFERLGAAPDLAALAGRPLRDHGLTQRETEVIRLVAAGLTNKAIAAELGVSERTIDRHVSNILVKLDVSSRTAATAYAYEHGLV